jgi:protein TonB
MSVQKNRLERQINCKNCGLFYLYGMKLICFIVFLSMAASMSIAGNLPKADTSKKKTGNSGIFTANDIDPEYPGGVTKFYKFILKNLQYPEVAQLTGLSGKVYVSFIIERDGAISGVKPVKCLGAGCESEAVRVVSMSPAWKPGSQNGRPVRVQFTMPISFTAGKSIVYLSDLKASDYGFVFSIKDSLYTIDEAKKIIGRFYSPNQLDEVDPFYNADNAPKFIMPDKKEVYLLKIAQQ